MAHTHHPDTPQEQPQSAAYPDYGTQQTPDPFTTSRFSAQAPTFQPLGHEMIRQPFHPTPPSSRHDSPLSPSMDLSLHVAHQHLKHTQDVVRLEHALRHSEQTVARLEATVRRDLRLLQAQMAGLQYRQDQDSVFRPEPGEFGLKRGGGIVEVVVPEPEVFLQRGVKEEHVALLYCEQAEALRETAEKLERDAEVLRGGPVRDEAVLVDTPTRGPGRRLRREGGSAEGNEAAEGGGWEPECRDDRRISTEAEIQEQPAETTNQTDQTPPLPPHEPWIPPAVRAMPPSPYTGHSDPDPESFSATELHFIFHGTEWSPGYHFVDDTPTSFNLLRSQSYWLIDLRTDPFMPREPGAHGAKLTAFFNQTLVDEGAGPTEQNYLDVPVFATRDGERYAYFGQYDQSRFSDRVGYDVLVEHVPRSVQAFWARELASPRRPEWVTRALMEQFWPRPRYEGPVPTDSAVGTPATVVEEEEEEESAEALEKRVVRGLERYAWELKAWEREARVKASCVSEEMVLAAFGEPDSGEVPGLRLWWEYFECRGWDGEFYDMLCQLRHSPRVRGFVARREREGVEEVEGEAERGRGRERVVASRGGGGLRDPVQKANVKGEASGKTCDIASSTVKAEAPPPPPNIIPPANEATDHWPDHEIPSSTPTDPPPQTPSSIITSKPPNTKEHSYFPSAKTPPHIAALEKKQKQKEKKDEEGEPGWGDLKAAKEFQRDATKAQAGRKGGVARRGW
ncbi:hypothetical protein Tdes44962_MAKER06827 [Teratosphaeria destructans]|uniref:DUF6697 domain-containing protein n=1 Tax=Teratosphaeria destructans TaxID=418781 RepID=A0A9W7T108_9PEZI|nr:hypothetical protein Tdes44962_MAKER06827 [Teratosphaeria destructans]